MSATSRFRARRFDLPGRSSAVGDIPESAREQPAPSTRTSVDDDVHSALINLGYRPKDAESALDIARKELGNEAELSALLKAALRQLTRS